MLTAAPGLSGVLVMSRGGANRPLLTGCCAADVSETELFDVFNKVGQVASVRVCRHNVRCVRAATAVYCALSIHFLCAGYFR